MIINAEAWIEIKYETVHDANQKLLSVLSHEKNICNFIKLFVEIRNENNDQFKVIPSNLLSSYKQSVLIIYKLITTSSSLKKYQVIWNVPETRQHHTLMIYSDFRKETMKFCGDIIADEIRKGTNGILSNYFASIKIYEIGNDEGQNLLMIAAIQNKAEIVEDLVMDDFDVDFEDHNGLNAIDYAWMNHLKSSNDNNAVIKEQSNKIIMALLKASSKYPKTEDPVNFNIFEASNDVKAYAEIGIELRQHIEDDELDELNDKLSKNPNIYHYDSNNQSLMKYAMGFGDIKLYKILAPYGITIGSHEKPEETFENFKDELINHIKDINVKNAFNLPDAHVFTILSKIKIGNNYSKYRHRCQDILAALKIMNRNPFCSKVLKIAAACKNLKIVLDFRHKSVNYIKPKPYTESTIGQCFSHGLILVGAKNFISGNHADKVTGVVVHELCHLAVLMTFMNNWNPYPIGNKKAKRAFKQAFKEASEECRTNQDSEEIIRNVFKSYNKREKHSELIVTVVQIFMQYYTSDLTKAEADKEYPKIQQTFPKLWKYFETFVCPAFDNGLEVLKKLQDPNQEVKFEELTDPMKAKILLKAIKFQGVKTSFSKIIGYDCKIFKELTSTEIKKLLLDPDFNLGKIGNVNVPAVDRKLIFSDSKDMNDFETVEQIEQKIHNEKIFVLGDAAGAGKTYALYNIAKSLKQTHKNIWVSLITLEEHKKDLSELSNIKNLNKNKVEEFLIKTLKKSGKTEVKIFKKLFGIGRVILLFDGADQISSEYFEILCKIVEILKTELNIQQWITSRLHVANKICIKFNIKSYILVPLTWKEKMSIIENIFKSLNGNNFEINKKFTQILDIIEYRKNKQEYYIENPSMLKVLARLFDNNLNKMQEKVLNIFNIFSSLCQQVAGTCWEPYTRSLSCEPHFVFAVWLNFNKELDASFINELGMMKNWNNQKKQQIHFWSSERIESCGFMYVDLTDETTEKNSAKFIHISYSEYFVAEYVTWFLFFGDFGINENEYEKVFKILKIIGNSGQDFEFIRKLILCTARNLQRTIFELSKNVIKNNIQNIVQDFMKSNNFLESLKFWSFLLMSDNELMQLLWLPFIENNLLKIILLEKSSVISSINFIKLLNIVSNSFGINWHFEFNFSKNELINDSDIENIVEGDSNDNRKFNTNLLKFLNLISNNYNLSEIVNIFESYILHPTVIINIRLEVIIKCIQEAKKLQKIEIVERIIIKYMTLTTDSNVLRYFGNKLVGILDKNEDSIRNVLFCKNELNPSLMLSILAKNFDIIQIFENLYKNYADLLDFQQHFINNCNLSEIFFFLTNKNVASVEHFILKANEFNLAKVKECIYSKGEKNEFFRISLISSKDKFSQFQNFIITTFPEDARMQKECISKMLHIENITKDHPIIQALQKGNPTELERIVNLYKDYEVNESYMQKIFTPKVISLELLFMYINSEIIEIFSNLMNNIFTKKKVDILKCIGDCIDQKLNLVKNQTRFEIFLKFSDHYYYNDEENADILIKKVTDPVEASMNSLCKNDVEKIKSTIRKHNHLRMENGTSMKNNLFTQNIVAINGRNSIENEE